jgi:hypothetical protein
MRELEISNYARQLFDLHGPKAVAIAAGRARDYEEKGDPEKAKHWQRIEMAVTEMRGPRET